MKRMSPAGVTFIVGAILVGLAAAYAVRHLSQPAREEAKAAPSRTKTIVVAKYNLPQYVRITEDYIDEVQVPADKVPEGALTLKSRALYRLAKGTILAGQPIRDQDLYAVGEVPLLSERLPPGYRAVTLAVDAKAAVNGMIQPESLVDITLTVKNERPEIGGLATMTLLRRVRVLATSRSRFPASEDHPGDLRNITVAVTPEQANKLILAEKYGTLSVVLCSKLEENSVESEPDEIMAAVSELQTIPASNPAVRTTAPTLSEEDNDLVNIYSLLGISPLAPEPMPEKP
ncbi:MAG: Flp pilus assembly protein CpaB, partial [Thermogutta sp.]